jgi:hypothetical protein
MSEDSWPDIVWNIKATGWRVRIAQKKRWIKDFEAGRGVKVYIQWWHEEKKKKTILKITSF